MILSGFRPALALRTNSAANQGSGLVRTTLVVLQFAVSIGLGIAALVVFAQISFAQAKDLGLNKDGMVVVSAQRGDARDQPEHGAGMAADPALKGAALSGDVPFDGSNSNNIFQLPGEPARSLIRTVTAGPDFFSLYGIKLLSGRMLSWSDIQHKHEAYNIVINASAAKRFRLFARWRAGQDHSYRR